MISCRRRPLSATRYGLGALARFLETQTDANILSTPNLVTLDNEEAKIVVGQNVPFITGSFTNTGTGAGAINPFQTIERKDVGLTLRIKPQIGEGGTIRMMIYQEISSVVPRARARHRDAGLTTDKRAIETTVVVDDGQIIVLGGLMKDEYSGTAAKVPLLGDMPLLGALFRSENRTRTKTNLMVFLRPVVMRDQDEPTALSIDRYDLIRARSRRDAASRASVVLPINERAGAAAEPRAAGRACRAAPPDVCPTRAAAGRRRRRQPTTAASPGVAVSSDGGSAMGARHPLPYAFAKANTLLLEDDGAQLRAVGRRERRRCRRCPRCCALYDVDALEREPARRWRSASPWPMPAASRAPRR